MDKQEKRESFSPPAVGGSSLLTVFAVLALTVFALLSLTTVRADVRLADASVEAVRAYYAADCRAQEILARLRNGEDVEVVKLAEEMAEYSHQTGDNAMRASIRVGNTYSYVVPISDTQELQVEVIADSAGGYEVLRWQAAAAEEWAGDDGFVVWDGE